MCPVCRHMVTKKPTNLAGRGLAVSAETAARPIAAQPGIRLLQVHSVFVRRWLLLGQAVDVAAPQ
jgi:hypothetical protein